METDPFTQNILGVANLISDDSNKIITKVQLENGVIGMPEDVLTLKMDDEELIKLSKQWEARYVVYEAKIKGRQKKNKKYYLGREEGSLTSPVSSNLIFESEEIFIPQALSKNPEPVVWSDNTDEGKDASNDIKTMLQYQAYTKNLRRKLGVMVRHWSIDFIGVVKHGWDKKINDFVTEIRKPKNFILDPNGYVNENCEFAGKYVGEKIPSTAKELIEMFPKHKVYITLKVDGKLGTEVVRTEWWTNEYCFIMFGDVVLDKYKNPFFNYDKNETDEEGVKTSTPGKNHFGVSKMPYTFLSVFSLQDQPHDETNLIEQAIPNQDRITERENQITRNLASANNSLVLSGIAFDKETATEAAHAVEIGHPILSPNGDTSAVVRLPANSIPNSVFTAQENDKDSLRSVFGTNGLSSQQQSADTTARGMILNQSHDSSRIGGGVGESIEAVASNIFNWWLQLMYVFYDEVHYGAMVGNGQAVTYVQVINSNMNRHFVVKVEPNSMQPKDEITEQNLAIQLYQQKALDPITLFKKLNYPDPLETAKMVTMWTINPQLYMQTFFPEAMGVPDSANPQTGQQPQQLQGDTQDSLSQPSASPSLSQVPLNQ
jgi:hypothetical protein